MKVEALAGRTPVTLPFDSTIIEAVKLMAKENIGLLVLVDSEDRGRVRAVVSERDIIRTIAAGKPLDRPVSDIATAEVVSVEVNSDVGEAARLMAQRRIRHLVVTRDGKLVSVISIRDLVGEGATLRAIVRSYEDVEPTPGAD